jgi:predicted nucleic acid-binding protein
MSASLFIAACGQRDSLTRPETVTRLPDGHQVDEATTRRAADLAGSRGLPGYDAVHCASAERIGAPDLVVASGDKDLLAACNELGLATALTGH